MTTEADTLLVIEFEMMLLITLVFESTEDFDKVSARVNWVVRFFLRFVVVAALAGWDFFAFITSFDFSFRGFLPVMTTIKGTTGCLWLQSWPEHQSLEDVLKNSSESFRIHLLLRPCMCHMLKVNADHWIKSSAYTHINDNNVWMFEVSECSVWIMCDEERVRLKMKVKVRMRLKWGAAWCGHQTSLHLNSRYSKGVC